MLRRAILRLHLGSDKNFQPISADDARSPTLPDITLLGKSSSLEVCVKSYLQILDFAEIGSSVSFNWDGYNLATQSSLIFQVSFFERASDLAAPRLWTWPRGRGSRWARRRRFEIRPTSPNSSKRSTVSAPSWCHYYDKKRDGQLSKSQPEHIMA
jgi:hypothetical protein